MQIPHGWEAVAGAGASAEAVSIPKRYRAHRPDVEGTTGLSEAPEGPTMAITITVEGMSCGHCEQTVEEALLDVEGVTSAEADREAGSATVDGTAEPSVLVEAVSEAGYTARNG